MPGRFYLQNFGSRQASWRGADEEEYAIRAPALPSVRGLIREKEFAETFHAVMAAYNTYGRKTVGNCGTSTENN